MLQARLAGGAAAAALLAHTAYVHSERGKAPTGRLLQFTPGSQDDLVAAGLKTGDLLLFRRDCTLYTCAGGLVCAARQRAPLAEGGGGGGGQQHAPGHGARAPAHAPPAPPPLAPDHAALVVLLQGVPHVLERGFGGPRLRPYEARVRCSRSREVVLRPLRVRLRADAEDAVERWAVATAGRGGTGVGDGGVHGPGRSGEGGADDGGGGALSELLWALPRDRLANASVALVAQGYAVAGLLPGPGVGGPPAALGGARGDAAGAGVVASSSCRSPAQQPRRISMRDLVAPPPPPAAQAAAAHERGGRGGGSGSAGPLAGVFGRDVFVRALR